MDRALNKEILRLALPSILANITVPLVGMVDTGVAGHLTASGGIGAASFIGAISIGALLFNIIYWNFSFLRSGTGGVTAQAFGRGDMRECAKIYLRSMTLSLLIAAVTIALQWPFLKLSLLLVHASPEVESLAAQYFLVRIWAAPATLSLMAFSGWFVGMQDSVSSMWKDLIVNGMNVVASIILSFGAFGWEGMGFKGVALGTVVAQYCGLLFCILVSVFKYGKVLSAFRLSEIREAFHWSEMKGLIGMNFNLFLRSVCFIFIYIGYTMIAARLGDMLLACSSIMMQLLMIFSYFTDGFAYAGEALTGRFIGEGNAPMLRSSVKYIFVWSLSIASAFIFIYAATGVPMLRVLTDDEGVVAACRPFLPWLAAMPVLGCVAFTWDGIFLGAIATRQILASMVGSVVAFLGVWWIGSALFDVGGNFGMHLLLAAYFAHLVYRSAYMSMKYKSTIHI